MLIKTKVKTKSKKQRVDKMGETYLVHLKSIPRDNKANIELIKVLEKHFKKEIKIKSGFKSQNKIIEIK